MLRFLETSAVVRYLTDDPPEMGERVERLLDGCEELRVTELILAESAHVLREVYGLPREAVVDLLVELIQRENIAVHGLDKATVIAGLLRCRPSGRISIPDALIWASAACSGPAEIYTFDRRFPADGVTLREPGS